MLLQHSRNGEVRLVNLNNFFLNGLVVQPMKVIVGYLPVQEGGGTLHDMKLIDLNVDAKDDIVMKYSIGKSITTRLNLKKFLAETQALIEKIRYILNDDENLLDPEMLQEVYDTGNQDTSCESRLINQK